MHTVLSLHTPGQNTVERQIRVLSLKNILLVSYCLFWILGQWWVNITQDGIHRSWDVCKARCSPKVGEKRQSLQVVCSTKIQFTLIAYTRTENARILSEVGMVKCYGTSVIFTLKIFLGIVELKFCNILVEIYVASSNKSKLIMLKFTFIKMTVI